MPSCGAERPGARHNTSVLPLWARVPSCSPNLAGKVAALPLSAETVTPFRAGSTATDLKVGTAPFAAFPELEDRAHRIAGPVREDHEH